MARSGAVMTLDRAAKVAEGIRTLATQRVMVGIPGENADRQGDGDITNAALGYIHENGAPEVGIPARPFLVPGVKRAQEGIVAGLRAAGQAALDGNPSGVERQLHIVGLKASGSVKNVLNEGVPPPLADSTIRSRHTSRGTKSMRAGEKAELANRAAGGSPGIGLVKPLVNTGQLRNAVTYVIRSLSQLSSSLRGRF